MSAATLAAAILAHPEGKRVTFTVPGRAVPLHGVVVSHRDTTKGPFITIRVDNGVTRSARPACVLAATFDAS